MNPSKFARATVSTDAAYPSGITATDARMSSSARASVTLAAAISCILAGGAARAVDATATADPRDNNYDLTEITVTATRRAEEITKVPINVTAYSRELMDDQGVRQVDDLARLTPDLQFTHTTGAAGNNSTNIAIRGVASDVGAATTGIYIDDTPIQMRNVGYWNANAFPQVFDLERVEVLRGPQGTLFGAGAEGGAVRFITPEPGLDKYTGYVRSEAAETEGGDPSYEVGGAFGGPIVDDRLGFRVSAWGRNDGGYIDRSSPDTGQTVDSKSNYQESFVGRVAVAAAPIDHLKVTTSLLYQDVYDHDRSQYWSTMSNLSDGDFKQGGRTDQPTRDSFYLPAIKVQYDWDAMSLTSNTSYFYHRNYADLDYTTYFAGIFDGNPLLYGPGDAPSQAFVSNRQNNFTQEVRLQSSKPSFIDWTVGLFYSDVTQNDQDLTTNGQASYTAEFGDLYSFTQFVRARDKQTAGFANVDINVTDAFKVIAGVRVSHQEFTYGETSAYSGVLQAPVSGTQSATPVTPKFGLSYQLDANNFVYATASKGFRQGGVNGSTPTTLCGADLSVLGLTSTPVAYSPDSLWSYEIGAKDTLFGGRLALDSSFYVLKWKNIQQSVRLPSCGFSYVANLGAATGIGGDISARVKVTDSFSTGINAGYVSLTNDDTVYEGANAILVNKNDVIGGAPFHLAAWTMYRFRLADHDAFYRIDYTFQNGTPAMDERNFSYDATLPQPGDEKSLSMRAGVYLSGWELSVFGNNLTNERSPYAIEHDIPASLPYYESGYRPLTYGVTASYRF
jgi:outer membrane receptor protein involved in Fe transport